MRISDLSCGRQGDRVRASATFTWEDCDRPEARVFIETEAEFGADLSAHPSAFLIAALVPAMHHGERRVALNETICPRLRNGLIIAMRLLRGWYGAPDDRLLDLEVAGHQPLTPCTPRRTASFMSGGVDALATLRRNRLDFPRGHAESIRDCFFIHGFDVGGYENLPDSRENSDLAISSLRQFAAEADASLIPVTTNLRHLDDRDRFFYRWYHGAVLAAIGHAFSRRINFILVPGSFEIEDLHPHGSHPLLDPNYSSSGLEMRQDGAMYTRLEKVRLISEWPAALGVLRCCFHPFRPGDRLNCGECEKCLRTMLQLLVTGKLDECTAFPVDDVAAELLKTLAASPLARLRGVSRQRLKEERELLIEASSKSIGESNANFWYELIEPLKRLGRDDLVRIIEDRLKAHKRHHRQIKSMEALRRSGSKIFGK